MTSYEGDETKLTSFGKNIYSQFGEDGIINKIFDIIKPTSKVCIEFGAWDGFHYSNTANLWTKEWKGILIEGDAKRFDQLVKNVAPFNCTTVCRYVGMSNGNSLEDILQENKIDFDIDLLSIDIDGDDYHILASLSLLRPRVIICEYNHTIPYWMDIFQEPGEYFGASVAALIRLAKDKGYQLITITGGSCIFIIESEYNKFEAFNTNLNDIADNNYLNFIITNYGGQYLVCGRFSFGIGKKYSMSPIVQHSGSGLFKLNLNICDISNNKTILKSLYYSIIKPMFNKQRRDFSDIRSCLPTFLDDWLVPDIPIKRRCVYSYMRYRYAVEYLFSLISFENRTREHIPHIIKRKCIRYYSKKYNIRIFVETGTYLGDMVSAMSRYFNEIHTIELFRPLYEKARLRFATLKNIHLYFGDSGTELQKILEQLECPALFWLDGHFSGMGTARGHDNSPVLNEINCIFKSEKFSHVVLIDDALLFNGTHGYPEINVLKKIVLEKRPNYHFEVSHNVIILVPKGCP